MKMQANKLLVLLLPALIALIGCQKNPQDEARRKLVEELGVQWSQETFIESAKNGNPDVVRLFLTAGMDPEVTDDQGKTALIWAAEEGQADTVKALLDNYADPNAIDNKGKTAMIWATEGDHIATVQALLDKGANVKAKALDASSALTIAQQKGYTELTKLFERLGLSEECYASKFFQRIPRTNSHRVQSVINAN